MPIFNEEETQDVIVSPDNVKNPVKVPEPSEGPSTWQITAAAFRQENTLGSVASFISRGGALGPRKDFYYDSVTPLRGTKYEDYVEQFFDADSDEDVETIKRRIDEEERDRQTLAEGGGTSIAALIGAGVLDPINLLPGAGFIAKGYRAAKLARGAMATRKAIAGSAARTAVVGAVSSSATEAIMQGTQEIRPIEESLTNIGVATIISGILGGSIAGVGKALQNKVAKDLTINDTFKGNSRFSTDEALEEFVVDPMGHQSLSAAAAPQTTLADESIDGIVAQKIARVFKGLNATFNLAQSASLEVRKIYQQLMESPFVFAKNAQGVETPIAVETRVKLYDNLVGTSKVELKKSYDEYHSRIKNLTQENDSEVPLDFKNFKDQVSLAMIRGDRHSIPEVQRAAEAYRKNVFDPLLKEAQSVGLLAENVEVKTAESYLTRIYDQNKITANRQGFKKILMDWLPGRIEQDMLKREILEATYNDSIKAFKQMKKGDKAYKEAEKKILKMEEALDNYRVKQAILDDGDIGEMADEIIAHTQGQKDGLVFRKAVPMLKGPLRERVLDIPDELIRDFLETDIETIAHRYTRTIAPEIELTRVFGSVDLKAQEDLVRRDYDKLINATNDPAKIKKLQSQRDNDIEDIKAIVGRLRGTYGRPNDADHWIYTSLQTARTANYLSKLGGVTISSIPDLARLVAIKGLGPVFTDGLIPMIKNFQGFKMAASEARLAGAAWETALNNSKALTMAELVDPVAAGNRIRAGLDALSDKFSWANLSAPFDAARKQFAAVIIQKKNLEDIERLLNGTLNKDGITDLAKNGIGKEQAAAINKMWKEFGTKEGELWIANTEKWTDKDAQLTYRAALNKQISYFSTMTGVGDRPRWMSTEVGKTIGQFESFNLAATSKILVSGLQNSDLKTMNSLALSVALGMIVYTYQQIANGKKLSDDPKAWLAAGIDRSGIFGVISSGNERIGRLSGGALSAGNFLGIDTDQYRVDPKRNVPAALGGPTLGMAIDMGTVFRLYGEKNKWDRQDTRAIRRLMPFQNLFWLRKGFDKLEDGINKSIGVKGAKK